MQRNTTCALVAFCCAALVMYSTSNGTGLDEPLTRDAGGEARYTILGEGDSRLLFDTQSGDTWVLRTVLKAVHDMDPAPIAVWFPIPRADAQLSKAIVKSRLKQLEIFGNEELKHPKKYLAEQESEHGSDHPRVLHAREALDFSAEVYGAVEADQLLPLFDR